MSTKTPVAQYEGKTLLAKYSTIATASTLNGIQPAHIGKVANGLRNTAGGFSWKSLSRFNGKLSPKHTGLVQSDLEGNVLAVYADVDTAAALTGINAKTISSVVSGSRRSVNGYIFS